MLAEEREENNVRAVWKACGKGQKNGGRQCFQAVSGAFPDGMEGTLIGEAIIIFLPENIRKIYEFYGRKK